MKTNKNKGKNKRLEAVEVEETYHEQGIRKINDMITEQAFMHDDLGYRRSHADDMVISVRNRLARSVVELVVIRELFIAQQIEEAGK